MDHEPVRRYATCLDDSVAKGGEIACYRWRREGQLDVANIVTVGPRSTGVDAHCRAPPANDVTPRA
jgi:hypothetical protein